MTAPESMPAKGPGPSEPRKTAGYEMDIRRWAVEQVMRAVRDGDRFVPMTDITSMAEHIARYILHGNYHGLCPLQSGHA